MFSIFPKKSKDDIQLEKKFPLISYYCDFLKCDDTERRRLLTKANTESARKLTVYYDPVERCWKDLHSKIPLSVVRFLLKKCADNVPVNSVSSKARRLAKEMSKDDSKEAKRLISYLLNNY